MAIPAGTARGSNTPHGFFDLAQMVRDRQGAQPGGDAVPQAGQSTGGGLDINTLLSALKSGQMSSGSLLQILALLMGMGQMPQGGNMAPIQNAGQGGPPGGPGGPAGPIGAAFMGAGAGGQ